jgi:hypothetical protein
MPKQRRVRGLRVIEYMAQPTSVKIFGLEGGVLDALETSLSRQRLATYVNAAGGDREQAVRLYTWNTAVSAAFYGPLQGLEVAPRIPGTDHDSLPREYRGQTTIPCLILRQYKNHGLSRDFLVPGIPTT